MKTTLRLIIIIILVFASLTIAKSVYNQASKFKEIYQAEGKVAKFTQQQQDLKTTLENKKSPEFVEKQARDKLGFQKPGDVLYVILGPEGTSQETERSSQKNWEEWIDFLFR